MATALPLSDKQVERWFTRLGYASLLNGTPVGNSTAVRAAPALIGLFLLVMLLLVPGAASRAWLTLAMSLVAVVALWVSGNLLRRRPLFAKINRIGWPERLSFVAVPALMVAITPKSDFQITEDYVLSAWLARWFLVALTAALQVVLLISVLAFFRLRVIAITGMVLRELFGKLGDTATVMARTLPLLLGVITFIYFTAEMWQSVGELTRFPYLLVQLVFIGFSAAFLLRREHLDIDAITTFSGPEQIGETLAPTQLAGLDLDGLPREPLQCPLDSTQERNLRIVAAVSRLVIAVVVGLAVWVLFFVLGVLSVNADVVKAWLTHPADTIWSYRGSGHTYDLTWQHLRVTGFLAVFSGFYYAVVSATDPALRQGLRDSTEEHARQACAARVVLLQRTEK